MRIAVTGATGFLGQRVVDALVRGGHHVVAIDRVSAPTAWREHGLRITAVALDLAHDRQALEQALQGADALVHLAAVMSGADVYEASLAMNASVLAAMDAAAVRKLIGISSIAVLDYKSRPPRATIDESVQLNERTSELGAYARMKRDQERAFFGWQAAAPGRALVVLRPGLVYDAARLMNAHAGFVKGSAGVAALHDGRVPLVHVDNVASAIVCAAEQLGHAPEQSVAPASVFNLVDDELPSQREYLALLKQRGELGAAVVPLPFRLYALLALEARLALTLARKAGKVPDGLREASVAARLTPFTFTNAHAKERLGWQPTRSFRTTFG